MSFTCIKCYKSFSSEMNLEKHLNRQKQCISEQEVDNADNTCNFCKNTFATSSSKIRHYKTCVVRNNNELLIKYVDEIIKQKDEIIEQLKKTISNIGNTNNIQGDSQTIDSSVNKNITNTDNSTNITNNITNNISINEYPFTFRTADMVYLMKQQSTTPEYVVLTKNIRKYMKEGDLTKMVTDLVNFVHNNKNIKQGWNVRYCKDGKYAGKYFIFDCDDDGYNYWTPVEIDLIMNVLSGVFKHIHMKYMTSREANDPKNQEMLSPTESKNIETTYIASMDLKNNSEQKKVVKASIKHFKLSQKQLNEKYIDDNSAEWGNKHPFDEFTSFIVDTITGKVNHFKEDESSSDEEVKRARAQREIEHNIARQKRKDEERRQELADEKEGITSVERDSRIIAEKYEKQKKEEKPEKSKSSKR